MKLMAVSLSKSSVRRISCDFEKEIEDILNLRAKKKVNRLHQISQISPDFVPLWELGIKLTESLRHGKYAHIHVEVEKELTKFTNY